MCQIRAGRFGLRCAHIALSPIREPSRHPQIATRCRNRQKVPSAEETREPFPATALPCAERGAPLGGSGMHAPVKVDGPAVGGTLAWRPPRHTLRPSRGQAEIAVRTLIRSAGDHPDPEGLIDIFRPASSAPTNSGLPVMPRTPADSCSGRLPRSRGTTRRWCWPTLVSCPIASTRWCRSPAAHIGYLPRDRIVGISRSPAS